jgi:hypothetical protein
MTRHILKQQGNHYVYNHKHHCEVCGSGLIDNLKKVAHVTGKLVFGDNSYPPFIKSLLQRFGNENVDSIEIVREPIQKTVHVLLNALSLGKFQDNIRRLNYDQVYHLFLHVRLSNNRFIRIEKNERLSLKESQPLTGNDNHMKVTGIPQVLSLNTLMQNTREFMGKDFFPYSASTNNCQRFVTSVLKANQLLTPEYSKFINQDAEELFRGASKLKSIADKVTNLGAKVDIIRRGGNINRRHRRRIVI